MENIRTHRGRRLKLLEWGLWKDLDRPGWYLLDYRPEGRRGPHVRRFVCVRPPLLTVGKLRDKLRRIHAEIEAKKAGVAVGVIPDDALADYLAELERLNRAPRHVSDVEACLQRFLDFAGAATLDAVSVPILQAFMHHVHEKGVTARTQNKYRGHLAAWFTWAHRRGAMAENPATRVTRATEVRRLKAFPLPDDFIALIDKAASRYDASLWTFLAFTGLRRGSFLGLDEDCFEDNGITVRTTKSRREWFLSYDDGCPLWHPALSVLGRAIWQERPPTPSYLAKHFEATCKKVGKTYTLHSLRHAFCSWLAMRGEGLQDIAAWANHSSSRTTEGWYAHLRPRGRKREAANRKSVDTMWTHSLARTLIAPHKDAASPIDAVS